AGRDEQRHVRPAVWVEARAVAVDRAEVGVEVVDARCGDGALPRRDSPDRTSAVVCVALVVGVERAEDAGTRPQSDAQVEQGLAGGERGGYEPVIRPERCCDRTEPGIVTGGQKGAPCL